MLLHIGNDVMIPLSDIVFILDINSCAKSKVNQNFIEKALITPDQRSAFDLNSKSLVVMQSRENTRLHYSPISSITLKKRAETNLL